MRFIGLTGSIATGKSTVTQFFREAGVPVIDTDAITQQLQQKPEVLTQLAALFGEQVIQKDGSLNRQVLGEIIFHDAKERKRLEDVMHPRIKKEMLAQAARYETPVVIFDVPLLFETDYYQLCDQTIVVAVDEATQLQRLLQRDGCDETLARAKIASQLPLAAKVARADYIIDNQGSLEMTKQQVRQLVDKLAMI